MEFEEFRKGCQANDGADCMIWDSVIGDSHTGCCEEGCHLWYLKKCMSAEIKASMPVDVAEMFYPDKVRESRVAVATQRVHELEAAIKDSLELLAPPWTDVSTFVKVHKILRDVI